MVPKKIVIDFLSHISNDNVRDDKYYVVNVNSYRKSIADNSFGEFCDAIRSHYIPSRQRYVDSVDSYSRFLTVIRQVCRVTDMEIKKHRVGRGHNNTFFVYHVYPGNENVHTI
jgi:hypothetical protein